MPNVGQLVVEIKADTSSLTTSMKRAEQSIKEVGTTAQTTQRSIAAFEQTTSLLSRTLGSVATGFARGLVTGAITAGVVEAARAVGDFNDALVKLFDQASGAHLDPEAFQVLQRAARESGASVDDLVKTIGTVGPAYQRLKDDAEAAGVIIPKETIDRAKALDDVMQDLSDHVQANLAPAMVELRELEVVATTALAGLTEQTLKSIAGTDDFATAIQGLSGYVDAAIVDLAQLIVTMRQVGEMGSTLARLFNAIQGLGGIVHGTVTQMGAAVEATLPGADTEAAQRRFNQGTEEISGKLNDLNEVLKTLQGQWANAFGGQEQKEAAEAMITRLANIRTHVDGLTTHPPVAPIVAKGADKAASDLKHLQDSLDKLGASMADLELQATEAGDRLVASFRGESALNAVENQQKVQEAINKTTAAITQQALAAGQSRAEAEALGTVYGQLAGQTVQTNQAISENARAWETVNRAMEDAADPADKLFEAHVQLDQAVQQLNLHLSDQQLESMHGALDKAAQQTKETESAVGDLSKTISDSLVGSFSQFAVALAQGKANFEEFTQAILADVAQIIIRFALMRALAAAFKSGGGGGISDGGAPFAKGGVFEYGHLTPFATGGIIRKPTIFPMANGMGLMGESGPEAVMPLARTPTGELGVKGGAWGGGNNVTVNVYTPPGTTAESKQRQNAAGDTQIDVLIQSRVERLFAQGRLDSAMSTNYGLARSGRR